MEPLKFSLISLFTFYVLPSSTLDSQFIFGIEIEEEIFSLKYMNINKRVWNMCIIVNKW